MQKLTQTLLAFLLLCVPVTTSAVAFDVMDTVAGLATEVVVTELQPGTQVELAITSPIGDSHGYTLNVGDHGIAHTWLAGSDLHVAGNYKVAVTDHLGKTTAGAITVYPDSIDPLRSFIEIASDQADVGEEVVATVVLMDRYGNALSARSVELLSSRPGDLVQAITRETDMYGEQQFIVRASESGEIALRAIDLISGKALQSAATLVAGTSAAAVGGPTEVAYTAPVHQVPQQQFYRGNPYSANLLSDPEPQVPQYNPYRAQLSDPPRFDHIKIEIIGQEKEEVPSVEQYKAQSMLMTAVDQYGAPFYDFTGNVYLATTDPDATLPSFGIYNFAFENEGQLMLTLGLKFASSGKQIMVLTERPDEIPEDLNQALGFLELNVEPKQVVIQEDQKINITGPAEGIMMATTEVTITGKGPSFINIMVEGGMEVVESETDRQGNFSVPITLDPSKTEQSITVKDKDTPANFAETTFSLDVTAPVIDSIAFTPSNPIEGTDVLVVVESEPGLQDITIDIAGETYQLMSTDPESGKYQKLFAAADEADTFTATVSAVDAQGNVGTGKSELDVALRGLPQVQNVIAEAQINAIALRWDPVTDDEIDAYRIFVGTSADDFDFELNSEEEFPGYTLDTDRPTAAATVAGLRPGTTYYFAVTALEGARQSEEMSDLVSTTVLGVKLSVTPGDGSLFVEWNSLQQDIPLSNFLLEYADAPEILTDPAREEEREVRTLNGQLRAFTLRDLLNGVTYFLKLTPITTTGEKLEDLAADGQGTPIGAGYTPGSSDPVPPALRKSAPPTPRPVTEIPLSEEGVPLWMLWSILAVSIGAFHVYLRRKRPQVTVAPRPMHIDSLYRR